MSGLNTLKVGLNDTHVGACVLYLCIVFSLLCNHLCWHDWLCKHTTQSYYTHIYIHYLLLHL